MYVMLQIISVIQFLLFWLYMWQPNLFINFDMHNDMIDF